MKLWAGRLSGDVDELLNGLNASIRFDQRMLPEDIAGSMAHARMLSSIGVLTKPETDAILSGLANILSDVETGRLPVDPAAEDVHTFVEAELTRRIGDPGKKLHTGRSRNDQVATDFRLYLLHAADALIEKEKALSSCMVDIAETHKESVMPGYTHLQRAQPVTLCHYLLAYAAMLLRDIERLSDCKKRTSSLPLGSGALAGTTFPLDRAYTAELLGFDNVCINSIDGVSDRDFAVEFLSCLSILMMHLSRLSEELILWCSHEFRFCTLSDSFSTGSSIMPQKKNPDVCELIRGKTGRVYGDLTALLTVMKGLPLAYNKDLQEDKEAVFDALDTASACLTILPPMLKSATFHTDNMKAAAAKGFINATDLADYLVRRGLPFRDAYRVSGEVVRFCTDRGETLETLPLSDYMTFSPLFDADVYAAVDLIACVQRRKTPGGPAPEAVQVQIDFIRKALL